MNMYCSMLTSLIYLYYSTKGWDNVNVDASELWYCLPILTVWILEWHKIYLKKLYTWIKYIAISLILYLNFDIIDLNH